MKKCVVVSDSFKGTVSSSDICSIAARVIPEYFDHCEVITIPVADGGEGTVDCFIEAMGARRVSLNVRDPLGAPVCASYARLGSLAVVEMAAAAGLPLLCGRLSPGTASTFGVGELIRHAIDSGCTGLLLGLGGSATNDGGCGCAAALGVRFYKESGEQFVPVGDTLHLIRRIDVSAARELLSGVSINVMCDVSNPLWGDKGAAHVFGPQKGADEQEVERLDAGLRHLGDVMRDELGADVSGLPGAGAAGGMGAGCVALLGARLQSGIDAVLDTVGFDEKLEGADLIITGEGRVDHQSAGGKLISGIAKRAKAKGVPIIVIAGAIDDSAKPVYDIGVDAMFGTDRTAAAVDKLNGRSKADYEATLRDIMSLIRLSENFRRS